ncbi:hypothetical protein OG777_31020 [Micromonospora peucetia]|nr:hypothetical protein [Micromonospora peucetia]MCX4391338.1 hypothetical protein [Micromonospora peucetia]
MTGQKLRRFLDLFRRLLAEHVLVDAAGHLGAGVSKDHLHYLDRDATGQHERARAVPGVVQPNDRQAASAYALLELDRDAIGPRRRTVRAAEDEIVIVVVHAEQVTLDLLGRPVPGECGQRGRGERHPSAARPRLRRLELPVDVLRAADRALLAEGSRRSDPSAGFTAISSRRSAAARAARMVLR